MYCIFAKRGDFRRSDLLHKTFGSVTPVSLDRRLGERRQERSEINGDDRRRTERRGPAPPSWTALGFVVVNRSV